MKNKVLYFKFMLLYGTKDGTMFLKVSYSSFSLVLWAKALEKGYRQISITIWKPCRAQFLAAWYTPHTSCTWYTKIGEHMESKLAKRVTSDAGVDYGCSAVVVYIRIVYFRISYIVSYIHDTYIYENKIKYTNANTTTFSIVHFRFFYCSRIS